MPKIIKGIEKLAKSHGFALYGFADLTGLTEGMLSQYGRAVSLAFQMTPKIMHGIANGPTREYAEEYTRVNELIDDAALEIAELIKNNGYDAWPVPSSKRTDQVNIKGDFPHKTAATRAGLGWIGRHCQLITRRYGPWIRLGTVLTDAPLPPGKPVERHFCGTCDACVKACPADALTGNAWSPGIERLELLDPAVCDAWKKEHFQQFHGGHNCGICTSACIFGQKTLKRSAAATP